MRAVWILLPIFVFAAAEARAESPVALSAVRYEAAAPAPVIRMPGEAQSGGQLKVAF